MANILDKIADVAARIPTKEKALTGQPGKTWSAPDLEAMIAGTMPGKKAIALDRAMSNKFGKAWDIAKATGKFGADIATYLPATVLGAAKNVGELSGRNLQEDIRGGLKGVSPIKAIKRQAELAAAALPAGVAIVGGGLAGKATGGMKTATALQRIAKGAATGGITGGLIGGTGEASGSVLENVPIREAMKRTMAGVLRGGTSGAVLGGAFAGAGEVGRGIKNIVHGVKPGANFYSKPISKQDFVKEVLPRTRVGYYGTGTVDEQYQTMLKKHPDLVIVRRADDNRVVRINDIGSVQKEFGIKLTGPERTKPIKSTETEDELFLNDEIAARTLTDANYNKFRKLVNQGLTGKQALAQVTNETLAIKTSPKKSFAIAPEIKSYEDALTVMANMRNMSTSERKAAMNAITAKFPELGGGGNTATAKGIMKSTGNSKIDAEYAGMAPEETAVFDTVLGYGKTPQEARAAVTQLAKYRKAGLPMGTAQRRSISDYTGISTKKMMKDFPDTPDTIPPGEIKTTNRQTVAGVLDSASFKGSKNIFAEELPDGKTAIYSYGKHFPMAVVDNATGNAIFNTDKYSSTTSRHQSLLRRELENRGIKIETTNTDALKGTIEGAVAPAYNPVKNVTSMADVQKANQRAGQHFFDRDTMNFFKSKIKSDLVANKYFITSETNPSGETGYTIRAFDKATGGIDKVGEFMQYGSLKDAKASLNTLVKAQTSTPTFAGNQSNAGPGTTQGQALTGATERTFKGPETKTPERFRVWLHPAEGGDDTFQEFRTLEAAKKFSAKMKANPDYADVEEPLGVIGFGGPGKMGKEVVLPKTGIPEGEIKAPLSKQGSKYSKEGGNYYTEPMGNGKVRVINVRNGETLVEGIPEKQGVKLIGDLEDIYTKRGYKAIGPGGKNIPEGEIKSPMPPISEAKAPPVRFDPKDISIRTYKSPSGGTTYQVDVKGKGMFATGSMEEAQGYIKSVTGKAGKEIPPEIADVWLKKIGPDMYQTMKGDKPMDNLKNVPVKIKALMQEYWDRLPNTKPTPAIDALLNTRSPLPAVEKAMKITHPKVTNPQAKTFNKITAGIVSGKDQYYDLGHFSPSNMADYQTMSDTINDMAQVYDINEVEAADIVQALTTLAAQKGKSKSLIEAVTRKLK